MQLFFITQLIRKKMYEFILKNYLKEGSILDVASGKGEFLEACKKLKKKVKGLDIEPSKKEILKWDITKKGFSKKYGKFDNLFCSQIIEHFNNDELINFIKEVAKKKVVIITPIENKRFWYRRGVPEHKAKFGHLRPYSLMEISYKMKQIGFKTLFKLKGINLPGLDSVIWIGEKA